MKKTLAVVVALALALPAASPASEVTPGNGPKVGDLCYPTDPIPRPGLICRPAFVEIDGQLREEWEYESGHVLNARAGDAVLSPGCGLIANLLEKVDETARYSHAGIMVEDRFKIRHSTAIPERMFDKGAGDPPGTEGVIEEALKYGWPGTITQWADEAFEGSILEDPVGGKGYLMTGFNSQPLQCESSGELVPSSVLRPPPTVEADPATGARDRLIYAAAAAEQIEGHYRFFGYTDPASVLSTPVNLPGHWADGTVGSVCSGLVWRAMKDVNFTLEGAALEPEDVARGRLVDAATPDGLYLYPESKRQVAAKFIYDTIYDLAAEEAGGWDIFVDAADDAGNQIVNCFGFDWCGETFTPAAAQNGCDPDDDRAQDSPCWRNEGAGVGRAVSPDDMLAWDAAPTGPYGYREDLQYGPGGYYRVYRWGPDAGTATLQGTVTDSEGSPEAVVLVEGLNAMDISTAATGEYAIEAVPAGPWTVRACNAVGRGNAAIVDMPPSGTFVQDLALQPGCDTVADPGKWKRQVRIHGTIKITDTEDIGSDEVDTFSFDEVVELQPNTPQTPGAAHAQVTWQRCTGNEVLAKFRFELDLDQHDRSVTVASFSKMFEGASCDNDDLDDTVNRTTDVPENGSAGLVYVSDNEEPGGEDTIHVNLTIDNMVAPAP
jgi:hypothetical protein